MPKEDNSVVMEDMQIIWKNFSGEKGPYNANGNREFSVILAPEDARNLESLGFNVKTREPREEGDDPFSYLTVAVKYTFRPPHIVMITSRARQVLTEDRVGDLDYVDIEKADLIINPSEWNVNGKTGIKAYVKSMYITIEEDALARKYAADPS